MKQLFFLFSIILITPCAYSQDILVLRNGDEVEVKVLEIKLSEIKYKKLNNLDGPIYTEEKINVFMIKYENGAKDVFNHDTQTKTDRIKADVKIDTMRLAVGISKNISRKRSYISEGDFILHLGSGIASIMGDGPGSILVPPLYIIGEYAASDQVSLGLFAGYYKYFKGYRNSSDEVVYQFSIGNYYFGGRFCYHFISNRKIDPYLGFVFGYDVKDPIVSPWVHNWEEYDYDTYTNYQDNHTDILIWGAFIGSKFYIKNKFSVFVEIGFPDISIIKAGFAYRFTEN
jgi:hypothetical protein